MGLHNPADRSTFIFIFIHQAGSKINNDNKLNYKHLIKYYNLFQNWQKPSTVLEIYCNINLSCLLLRTCKKKKNGSVAIVNMAALAQLDTCYCIQYFCDVQLSSSILKNLFAIFV